MQPHGRVQNKNLFRSKEIAESMTAELDAVGRDEQSVA